MALALLGASGAAVTAFYQQAEIERQEANRARLTAFGLRQDLADTREIAERLELRYEQSRLTRTELAKRLARTDGKVADLRNQLKDEERRLTRTRDRLAQNRQEKAEVEQHLSETERDLSDTERRLTATQQKLSTEEDAARRLGRQLLREKDHKLELQAELVALEARLDAEATKTEELQSAIARAVAARSRAELEMEFLQEELEALRIRNLPREPEPDNEDEPSDDSAPSS